MLIFAFITYFSILLSIGIFFHKKQKSDADFIVGNRSLNFWLTAFSAHASDMSAWLFMGLPSAVFIGGLSQSWIALGLMLGMFLTWQLVARKLRTETEKQQSYTLSTYFQNRFQDHSGTIRIITAAIQVIFLTCYLSAGLIAMGLLIESVFHIDYYIGLSIAILVAVTYTFYGGFETIAWMDFFQALFLLCVILFVPIFAFIKMDNGIDAIQTAALNRDMTLNFLKDTSFYSILSIVFLVLSWGLGYFGQPHIITKFMGIKDASEMNKAKYLGMSWQILALTSAVLIGLVGIGFFGDQLVNPELVFVEMVKSLFHPFIVGFILCGVIAANMSTMDSQILVCASVLSEDIYKYLVRKKATQKELLKMSRLAVVLVSAVALFIAFNRSSTVLDAVMYAWSGLGSAFGPLVLMSLYSTKANKFGAIAGILVGGTIAGTWPMLNPLITDFAIPSMIPGFFLSLLSIYVFSLLDKVELT